MKVEEKPFLEIRFPSKNVGDVSKEIDVKYDVRFLGMHRVCSVSV